MSKHDSAQRPDSRPPPSNSYGVGNGFPLQYSCLDNSVDRGAWWATVHGVTESDATQTMSTALRCPKEQALKSQGQRICHLTAICLVPPGRIFLSACGINKSNMRNPHGTQDDSSKVKQLREREEAYNFLQDIGPLGVSRLR